MPKGSWREFSDAAAVKRPVSTEWTKSKEECLVRVQRVRGGKAGKTVTVITGLELDLVGCRALLKGLKAKAGTGGTVKADSLELQGDHVDLALEFLQAKGYRPKQSGG